MAELTEAHRRELVELLACYRTTTEIITHFRDEHGLDVNHKQVGAYDPTRSYYEGGEKWREVFDGRRAAYLANVQEIPVANQSYRLQLLQEGIEYAKKVKDWKLAAELAEQAAKEVGGSLTNERKHQIDDRRAVLLEQSPDERLAGFAEVIRQAMEAPKMKLAKVIDAEAKEIE